MGTDQMCVIKDVCNQRDVCRVGAKLQHLDLSLCVENCCRAAVLIWAFIYIVKTAAE